MSDDLETFRRETRAWLEANCPVSQRQPATGNQELAWGGRNPQFASEDQRLWLERMVERGWTAPTWPKEYGGGGLSKEAAQILTEELFALKARPALASFGVWMLGPALLKFGTDAQKNEHLPKIVKAQIRWCQGYSEPNAGSDLASLQTKAEDKGDHYLVNGSKVWTSYADKADWIFFLARTDPKAPKHKGISFLLCDMRTPGVSTKPIKLISGVSPFCETFFDNVKVPKENVIGPVNKGWDVAMYLLTHEREMISAMGSTPTPALGIQAAELIGTENGRLRDPILRAELAAFDMDVEAYRLTQLRLKEETPAGQGLGAVSSILKYYGTELNKKRQEFLLSIHGIEALEWGGENAAGSDIARTWLRSKANSIEGGTSEIQLNIIAKRILGLPSS